MTRDADYMAASAFPDPGFATADMATRSLLLKLTSKSEVEATRALAQKCACPGSAMANSASSQEIERNIEIMVLLFRFRSD